LANIVIGIYRDSMDGKLERSIIRRDLSGVVLLPETEGGGRRGLGGNDFVLSRREGLALSPGIYLLKTNCVIPPPPKNLDENRRLQKHDEGEENPLFG